MSAVVFPRRRRGRGSRGGGGRAYAERQEIAAMQAISGAGSRRDRLGRQIHGRKFLLSKGISYMTWPDLLKWEAISIQSHGHSSGIPDVTDNAKNHERSWFQRTYLLVSSSAQTLDFPVTPGILPEHIEW
jgi:hypothetical protein